MRKTGSREEPEWQEITSFLMGHNVWENGTIIFISARIHCHPVYLLKRRTQLLLTVRVNQSVLCRTASGKLAFSLLHRAALGLWLLSQSSIRCSVTSLVLHGEVPCVLGSQGGTVVMAGAERLTQNRVCSPGRSFNHIGWEVQRPLVK